MEIRTLVLSVQANDMVTVYTRTPRPVRWYVCMSDSQPFLTDALLRIMFRRIWLCVQYDGDWVAGKREGHAVWAPTPAAKFVGTFSADQPVGAGHFVFATGTFRLL